MAGLLGDNPAKRAARVGSLPVLGPLDSAAHWAPLHGITHLIVAMPSATKSERRRALDLAAQTRLPGPDRNHCNDACGDPLAAGVLVHHSYRNQLQPV